LSQELHVVAPRVLEYPAGQSLHLVSAGLLPIVPALHAMKLLASASINEPSGTTTEEEPPCATIEPAWTLVQMVSPVFGCKYPIGHALHLSLPVVLET
jgi:hypothetical protein